ncbi:MAG: serine/threonine-protein kinase [Planctomycetota bacterium]|nr:serine/threonine-protein kinase [Planctomycetota bacterium]
MSERSVYAFQVRWLLHRKLISPEMLGALPSEDNTDLSKILIANHLITRDQSEELEEATIVAFQDDDTTALIDDSNEGTAVLNDESREGTVAMMDELEQLVENAQKARTGPVIRPTESGETVLSGSGKAVLAGSGKVTLPEDREDTVLATGSMMNELEQLVAKSRSDKANANKSESGDSLFPTTFDPNFDSMSIDQVPTRRNTALNTPARRPSSRRYAQDRVESARLEQFASSDDDARDTVPIAANRLLAKKNSSREAVREAPRQVFGDYEIVKKLSQGAMGEIFEARHRKLGHAVAIKTILSEDPSAEDKLRFEREAKVLAQLEHPNIVRILDYGHQNNTSYIVMELIEGEDLQDVVEAAIQDKKNLPALDWVIQKYSEIASALGYCHSRGIVHRDVKPANILIEKGTERPVLIDFGLVTKNSKDLSGSQSSIAGFTQDVTRASAEFVRGTPFFISPEQVRADEFGVVGTPSDVWAYGVSLFFALTGQPPFLGASIIDILEALLEQNPPAPSSLNPEVPRWLDDLVLGCLKKHSSYRPKMSEVFARLQDGKVEPPRKNKRNRWYPVLVAAVVLVIGTLLNSVLWLFAPVPGSGKEDGKEQSKVLLERDSKEPIIRAGVEVNALKVWAARSPRERLKLIDLLHKKIGPDFDPIPAMSFEFDGKEIMIPRFRHRKTRAEFQWVPGIRESERLLSD